MNGYPAECKEHAVQLAGESDQPTQSKCAMKGGAGYLTKGRGVLRATAAVKYVWMHEQHTAFTVRRRVGSWQSHAGATPSGFTARLAPRLESFSSDRAKGSRPVLRRGAAPKARAGPPVGAGGTAGQPPPHWARARPGRPALQNAARMQSADDRRAGPDGGPKPAQPGVDRDSPRDHLRRGYALSPDRRRLAVSRRGAGLCSRAVVGGAMANHWRAERVKQALSIGIGLRQPVVGLIMYTDRGSQYGADS